MAKGKNLNPADAFRKAQRKKELKKNKAERSKARDFALVKKDTRELEDEIDKLEASAEPSASDKSRLTGLKSELAKIVQKKEEYVKEHPEQRKLVYRARKQGGEDQKPAPPTEQKRNLFNKHGLPRHPERSIYYDPVMNPYGVPPPGMPYVERPLTADAVDSDENIGDSDEEIVMPEGPPPGASLENESSDNDSDNDIPMPEGPPPGLSLDPSYRPIPPPLPPSYLPMPSFIPPPPPLPGFDGNVYPSPLGVIPPPPPPPGFFPRRIQSAASIQDPLSSIPHRTYQAHRTSQLPPGHPSLPPKPLSGPPVSTLSGVPSGSIISAGPELRDLKKEATAFVPASLKRKKASGLPGSSKINAAPSVNVGSETTSPHTRPDLVGVLKSQLGTAGITSSSNQIPGKGRNEPIVKERDDYEKYVDEMSDLLNPLGSS